MAAALDTQLIRDPKLREISSKVESGERLGFDEGMACLETDDLFGLGRIADRAAFRRNGDRVFYVLNRQLNPTNLCVLSCKFCDFAAKAGDSHAYEMGMDAILAHVTPDIDEIHIVGGLHPKWKFTDYVAILRAIREKVPQLAIKAWTAVEVDWFTRISKQSLDEVFAELK
ncbi:MAG: aminofutalosine synthase MqnE, partial [bacterium]